MKMSIWFFLYSLHLGNIFHEMYMWLFLSGGKGSMLQHSSPCKINILRCISFFLSLSNPHLRTMLIDFREREWGKREGEKDSSERETSIGCLLYAPQPGTEHAIWVCGLSGNQTYHLLLYKMTFQLTEPHRPGQEMYFLAVCSGYLGGNLGGESLK